MKKLYSFSFSLLFLIINFTAFAQVSDRLVYFTDKSGTPFSISNPSQFLTQRAIDRRNKQGIAITEQDLPVSPDYLRELTAMGAVVRYPIKWFNAAIVRADETTFEQINTLSFVKSIENISYYHQQDYLNQISAMASTDEETEVCEEDEDFNYGNSATQIEMIGIDDMHKKGYTGDGVHIAVLDGGFINVPSLSALSHMKNPYNFDVVGDGQNVFQSSNHGTRVLSIMAAKADGQMIGTAPDATYYLFRTEDRLPELPIEEAYWAVGAEKADSLGVDIIQSSLGYYNFDKAQYNYTHADLDGQTSLITRAADIAHKKGIVVVTSAGNEGNDTWQKISFPADAFNVIAVGAVDANQLVGAFSSKGNTADGRVKPDIMAMGVSTVFWNEQDRVSSGNGTSYASPIIAGMVAGLIQKHPTASADEIVSAVRRSGDRFSHPDTDYGYGLPHFARMDFYVVNGTEKLEPSSIQIFPNPFSSNIKLELDEKIRNEQVTLKIFTVQGVLVDQLSLNPSQNSISLSTLSKGLYILQLETSRYVGMAKIIKE